MMLVIPAQAGIQFEKFLSILDPRLRGGDSFNTQDVTSSHVID